MDLARIIIEPIITEKGMAQKAQHTYLFRIMKSATKIDVKKAVKKLFKVDVVSVNTVSVRGKKRMTGRGVGFTASSKKAYVTVKQGQKIEELEV